MQRDPQPQDITEHFADRHIGPRPSEWNQIANALGLQSIDELIHQAVPQDIRAANPLNLPSPAGERDALLELERIVGRNQRFRSFIGLGYYGAQLPPVIQRNILENPGWYTQYTPYQSEIAQGRLEALLNFQTMVTDLTGMDISNASLLDEATAAAEAMSVAFAARKDKSRNRFFASSVAFPQTLAVLRTRAEPLGIELVVGNEHECDFSDGYFGALFQYPNCNGELIDLSTAIASAKQSGAIPVVAADLLALTLFKEPGAMGAEIVVGNAQRFGVPLGFGGPHPAYIASINKYRRLLPGRIVGISKDAQGKPAYRLALQTREQHIRRERATSNICTAQVLLAIIAAMFAVYHGPRGLRAIAERIRRRTAALKEGLESLGHVVENEVFFDTLVIRPNGIEPQTIHIAASQRQINLRQIDDKRIGVSLDEQATMEEVQTLLSLFVSSEGSMDVQAPRESSENAPIPEALARTSDYLTHSVFHRYRSETEMLRYLKRLEGRDLSLTTSMIPLGSCTMKLNAAAEMLPVTWPEVSDLHPFAPGDQFDGYRQIFDELGSWLAEITGFEAVSFQPNAGAQGEYAGLLAIRAYHRKNGDFNRDICLIPTSAHGTNPASAIMAGLKVTPIRCDEEGNIDLEDLRAKAAQHSNQLAALMVTYPSTHGVFEEGIKEFSRIVHDHGGLVYMDGANLNAQVGICRPGDLGADVCHINLHKTFCIPHGGGGPGMGPIAVNEKLAPFLPGHPLATEISKDEVGPIAAAPWSSASILVIPWMYIRMMGGVGLRNASEVAILNANYIARKLEKRYNVLYRGAKGWVAHELILDLRDFKSVTVEDVAKRLIDFGYHAPTVSWPVPGSLMIEPTESESQEELDRFCEAMLLIRDEIDDLEAGSIQADQSPLKNAPHTAEQLAEEDWPFDYSRKTAAYPAEWVAERKFWPAVSRIDNVYGDRNPICSCVDMQEFEEAVVSS